jgi:hypothetical protein
MPTPPQKGESQNDFISRCVSYLTKNEKHKYPKQSQRVAICFSMWRRAKGKTKPMSKLERLAK